MKSYELRGYDKRGIHLGTASCNKPYGLDGYLLGEVVLQVKLTTKEDAQKLANIFKGDYGLSAALESSALCLPSTEEGKDVIVREIERLLKKL